MKKIYFLGFAVAVGICASPHSARAQQQMCMLNTPPGYRSMGGAAQLGPLPCGDCQNSITSQFQGNPQATCSTVAPSSSSTGGSSSRDVRVYGMQTAVSSFIAGWQRGREMARQRALMEEQQRQARVQLARERVRAAEAALAASRDEERRRREAEFLDAKNQLSRELRGLSPPTDEPGGLKRDDAPTINGALKRPSSHSVSGITPGRRIFCSAAIAQQSTTAALRGDVQEAVYLARQSSNAFNGGELGVECPTSTQAPDIGAIKCSVQKDGRAVPVSCDDDPVLQRFFPALLESTQYEVDRLAAVHGNFPDLARAKLEADEAVKAKRKALQFAREEANRQSVTTPSPAPISKTKPKPAACSTDLCREAEAELKKAQQDEDRVNTAVSDDADARKSLQRNEVILREVQSDPAELSKSLSKAPGSAKVH